MRILVSGGGSAGHITPTLAVCASLSSLDSSTELLYVGQASGMEARIVAASGIGFAPIQAGKLRRGGKSLRALGLNVRDAGLVAAGIVGALKVLQKFKPDILFLKGGFVCLPVGLAAKLLHIPYIIHESDIHAGLTNRILGRWATVVAVGFPVKNYVDFAADRMVFTGTPVRAELTRAHRLEGLAAFKLESNIPVILVTGGSQGAVQINDVVIASLGELLPHYQIIHQTGEYEFERIKFELSRMGKLPFVSRYHPTAFLLGNMPAAYAASDLVVSRAGAQTIAEVAVLGKPTILIPNYQAAAHQLQNARMLSRAGAARVLDGSKLTATGLVGEVKRILDDPAEQASLERGIRAFGRPGAAKELAQLILATGREGTKRA